MTEHIDRGPTTLDRLVAIAFQKYKSTERDPNDPEDLYTLYHAAIDSVKEMGCDVFDLASRLQKETTFSPAVLRENLLGEGIADYSSWQELNREIAEGIVLAELEMRHHKKIQQIDSRREAALRKQLGCS